MHLERKKNMNIQTTELATKLIVTRIREAKKAKQKNLSVSTIFKQLRGHEGFSLIGDFPLIGLVVCELKKDFPVRRDALFRLFAKSDELSELSKGVKQQLVDNLLRG